MRAWTYTYDCTYLTGGESPKLIDNAMREMKSALQERLAVDHVFDLTGTEVSNVLAGRHNRVMLREQAVKPDVSATSNEGALYTKETGGVTELWWEGEDGTEKQLTVGGQLKIGSGDLDLIVDDSTIQNNAGTLRVKAVGITETELHGDCVDGSTLQKSGGTGKLQIMADGVDSPQIADDAVDPAHLNVPTAGTGDGTGDGPGIAIPVIAWGQYTGTGNRLTVQVAASASLSIRHIVIKRDAGWGGVEGIRGDQYPDNGIVWFQDTGAEKADGDFIDMDPAEGHNYFAVAAYATAGGRLNENTKIYEWYVVLDWAM